MDGQILESRRSLSSVARALPVAAWALGLAMTPFAKAQLGGTPGCANSLRDQAHPATCIQASSLPQDGMLLPLGPFLFVDPGGFVGIGTKTPLWTLDVDASGSGGMRIFDGSSDLLRIDAAAASLHLDLPQWNVESPTIVTLPDAAPALNFKASNGWSVLSIDALNRRVGISGGSADVSVPLYPLHVQHNVDDDSGIVVARFLTDVTTPNDNANWYLGSSSTARAPGGSSSFDGGFIGLSADGHVATSGTVNEITGVWAQGIAGSTCRVKNAWGTYSQIVVYEHADVDVATGVHAGVQNLGDGEIEEARGLYVQTPTGAIDRSAGVYIDSQVTTGTESWALYAVDSPSYFGGNVGIGTPKVTNILTVQKNSPTDPIADAWTTYSSRRWKQNVETLDGALDKVRALRGVSYEWKDDGRRDVGFIAEEVAEVVPEIVQLEEDGVNARSLDYSRLTALLVEAVKAQQAQIERLEREIVGLKGTIAAPPR